MSRLFVCDVETVACADADHYIEPASAPSNYVDPVKIAAYISNANAAALREAALDIDLAEIVALGIMPLDDVLGLAQADVAARLYTRDTCDEAAMLKVLDGLLRNGAMLVTFNGRSYDLPLIRRRFMYHGLDAPVINMDRYRSEHIDLYQRLTYDGALKSAHKLSWYAKRFGWTDIVSRLSGADMGAAVRAEDWAGIREHLACDLIWTARLAQRIGVS